MRFFRIQEKTRKDKNRNTVFREELNTVSVETAHVAGTCVNNERVRLARRVFEAREVEGEETMTT